MLRPYLNVKARAGDGCASASDGTVVAYVADCRCGRYTLKIKYAYETQAAYAADQFFACVSGDDLPSRMPNFIDEATAVAAFADEIMARSFACTSDEARARAESQASCRKRVSPNAYL
jgi:hypothetical protein